MLALRLPSEPLLTEAYTLGAIINKVLLNRLFPSILDPVLPKIILAIFCKKVFAGNLFDSRIKISAVI